MSSITKFIDRYFSNKYSNIKSLDGNFFLLFLYRIAYPTSVLFASLRIKPNHITLLSSFFAGVAFGGLVLQKPVYFVVFWLLTMHLDFCDGTVARMTNKVSKTALRLDHLTDIFKVCLVFLGVGIAYNNNDTWILIFCATFFYMYFEVLSHEMKYYTKFAVTNNNQINPSAILDSDMIKNIGLLRSVRLRAVLRNIHSFFFNANAHTLIFFVVFPLGVQIANIFLSYFGLICLYGAARTMYSLHKMRR